MAIPPTGQYQALAAGFFKTVQSQPGQFTPKADAAQNVRATLDNARLEAVRQNFYVGVTNQLEGIRQGLVEPREEWELVGGFLQAQGTPFRIIIDGQEPRIVAQADSDLSEFAETQRTQLRAAFDELDTLFQREDEVRTKIDLNVTLANAADRLAAIKQFAPAQAAWEFEAKSLISTRTPFQIALDANGNVTLRDQTEDLFLDRDARDRAKLSEAVDQWERILDGSLAATETWQFQALGNTQDGDDFFLDLDDAGEIVVKRNSFDNILPDFLEVSDGAVEGATPWQRDALDLYRQGIGFYLDFDASGRNIVVKENNYINVSGLTDPDRIRDGAGNALLNLLA